MTIIVSVKINDGIIMAADSAITFQNGQIYQHANKIVNLRKGLPIGVMSTGDGGIGNESLETLFKDLRNRFSGADPAFQDWRLDPLGYTMSDVATKVRDFLFLEKAQGGSVPMHAVIHICGYSAGRPLAETWFFTLDGTTCSAPKQIQSEQEFGPLWNGQIDALNRLIFGIGSGFVKAGVELGFQQQQVSDIEGQLQSKLYAVLFQSAMPIQDAIDLVRFLAETTSNFVKFSIGHAKTVGGTTEIAAITKHEGFRWVQRKHFYQASLNP